MTQALFYPEITPELKSKLSMWANLIEANPDYLKHEECPYTHDEVELLQKLAPTQTAPNTDPYEALEDELDNGEMPDFEQESIRLFKKMKTFQSGLSKSDTSEMTSTFRTMVSLMEKIITVQERAAGINHFGDFKQFILDSMDRYLSPTQKSEFVDEMHLKLHQD